MFPGPRLILPLCALLCVSVSCLMTDELGITPANGIRADLVGRRVQRAAMNGLFTGASAYTNARQLENIATYDMFGAAMMFPLAAEPIGYNSETVFYTASSVKQCERQALAYAGFSTFLTMNQLNLDKKIANTMSTLDADERQEFINQVDFVILFASYNAIAAADIGCREVIVRTGRVFELGSGRL